MISCNKTEDPSDTIQPFITMKGDNPVWIRVGEAYTEPGAHAWDVNELGDTISISNMLTIDNNVNTDIIGGYRVIYNVKDASGNEAKPVVRNVYVNIF
jgi:hypothetical protein